MSSRKKYLKQYHALDFALIPATPRTKDARILNWNRQGDLSARLQPDDNIGLNELRSFVCVVDIDDLKALKRTKLWKVIKRTMGIRYTSGRENRLKILYRLSDGMGIYTVPLPKGVAGQIRCADSNRNAVYDIVPPSVVYNKKEDKTYHYYWIDKLPAKRSDIPMLPEALLAYADKKSKKIVVKARGKRKASGCNSPFAWTQAVNECCSELGLFRVFMGLVMGYYEETARGYRRLGSTSTNNIEVHDEAYGINFSDSPENVLPYCSGSGGYQPISAWDILVSASSVSYARRSVCNGNVDRWLKGLNYTTDIKERVDEILKPSDREKVSIGGKLV